jgi:hypothetical protein
VEAEASRALADILACAGSKPLKTLPRELLATAARAAVLAGDARAAAEVARAMRSSWRVAVGGACVASDALAYAGHIGGE